MEKTTTLNIRVNPEVKRAAENVLDKLGIPMSTAIDMYLRQITITSGIPFPINLHKAPKNINAEYMSASEIRAAIATGHEDVINGRTKNAREVFDGFMEKYGDGNV